MSIHEKQFSYLVTAIVSTFNSEQYLKACINDLLNQTLYKSNNLEIIIIDSGSQQNENIIARDFISCHPHIVYQRTDHETVYGSWNKGTAIARGKYITNANTDDAHREDALELLAEALEHNNDADMAYCNWRWTEIPNDNFSNPVYLKECHFPPYDPAVATLYCILGPHPMWRRTLFDRIGYFDASLKAVGDYDFQFRFIASKCKAVLVPEVLSLFYVNREGLSRKDNYSDQEAKQLYEKYQAQLPIDALFAINLEGDPTLALSWIAMGVLATRYLVPWNDHEQANMEYAAKCFYKAFELDPSNTLAIHNLTATLTQLSKSHTHEQLAVMLGENITTILSAMDNNTHPINVIETPIPPPAVDPIIFPETSSYLSTRPFFEIWRGDGFYGDGWIAQTAYLFVNTDSPTTLNIHLTCCHDPSYYDKFPFETVIKSNIGLEQRVEFNAQNTSAYLTFNINQAPTKCLFYITNGASFTPSENDPNNDDSRNLSLNINSITLTPLKNITGNMETTHEGNNDTDSLNGLSSDNEIAICTAVSKNYLAFARTFSKAVRLIHPKLRIFVLLVDQIGTNTFDPKEEPFDLILIDELDNIPNAQDFFFKYNTIELNTASKPFVFEYIFKKYGVQKLAYFDPDILVFDSLQKLWDLLDSHNLVLTPHITQPYPDKLNPSALGILQAGIYNLGFIGMANTPDTLTFLKYWQDHLYSYCFMKLEKGMHVDQNWVNFAPCMFEGVFILKDPAYNAAYWNLHYTGKQIYSKNNKYFIGDTPLVFFHFSSFKLNNLEGIATHQNRYTLNDFPNLRPLFETYRDLLLENNHEECLNWPYAYGFFDNGVKIAPIIRDMFNELHDKQPSATNPFETQSSGSFFDLICEPCKGEDPASPFNLSYLISYIYSKRADLQTTFPDPTGINREEFIQWFHTIGREEYMLDPCLMPGTHEFKDLIKERITPSNGVITKSEYINRNPGINFLGYYRGQFGVAVAARNYVHAADSVHIPYTINNLDANVHCNTDDTFQSFSDSNQYDVNFIHVNADQALLTWQQKGSSYYKGHFNIGFWVWELGRFPTRWQPSYQIYDEIWTPSEFSRKAIASSSPIPVYTIPHPIVIDMHGVTTEKSRFKLPDDQYVFLFVFDYLSVFERKNPLAVISAFRNAFGNSNQAMLLIKTINAPHAPDKASMLNGAISGSNIRIIDQHLDGPSMISLMATSDCFVSLHRSEGFGLGMAQSMFLGKPVIATGYSGNMEFMNHRNSLLVDYNIVELKNNYGPYERGNVWAEPDIEHAAYLMRNIYENTELAESIGTQAALSIHTNLSPQAIGAKMKTRIAALRGLH